MDYMSAYTPPGKKMRFFADPSDNGWVSAYVYDPGDPKQTVLAKGKGETYTQAAQNARDNYFRRYRS